MNEAIAMAFEILYLDSSKQLFDTISVLSYGISGYIARLYVSAQDDQKFRMPGVTCDTMV